MATLEGKSQCTTPFGLYPASRVSGRGPAGLGKSKLLLDDHNGLLAVRLGQRAEAAVAELDLQAMNLPTVSSGVPNLHDALLAAKWTVSHVSQCPIWAEHKQS